jgi:hypothetical protein
LILKGEQSGLLTLICDGKRYIVRGDEMLMAFVELEGTIRGPWLWPDLRLKSFKILLTTISRFLFSALIFRPERTHDFFQFGKIFRELGSANLVEER